MLAAGDLASPVSGGGLQTRIVEVAEAKEY
jgi:hypothetical protein